MSPRLESLESRQLLSGTSPAATLAPAPIWTPTDSNLLDAQDGPMANLGVNLVSVYQASLGDGSASLAAQFPTLEFQGNLVGVQVKSLGGDFTSFVGGLQGLGLQVTASSAAYGLVDGYIPAGELPAMARLPQVMSGSAIENPITYAFSEYQGIGDNESQTAMAADAARAQFGVDGTGVKIGVLSDSVNQYRGGLAQSYATGDLDPNNPVQVIQDGPPGSSDEGRAILESIHDIAPGASLAFATAEGGDLNFAQSIEALAAAGSNIIVDDVGYPDEPMFQDGLVAQAVDQVTASGVTYFSAAGNEGPDSGYLSTFRPVNATIPGVGSGTFMNFNPNGGTTLELPITTSIPFAQLVFQYDQPFAVQQPAGSPGRVTSNVDIEILNSSGQVVVGADQNIDNIAQQMPLQVVAVPAPGNYEVVVRVVKGTAPGHIELVGDNDTNTAVTISQEFGGAGGTSYPSSFGHSTAAATIGVGAVPWWAPAPYLGQNPLASEPFSSPGPALYDLSIQGTPVPPQIVDNPTITAPDGGNTSFFIPGFILDTTSPQEPGEPATATDLVPAPQQGLPSFFGTSQAAPDAAAVAALMIEIAPTLSPAQVRDDLIASAQPMNGTPAGTWDPQAGYGLINAVAALALLAPPAGAATTTTVTGPTTSLIYGQSITLSASVASAGPGTPGGSVDFVDTATGVDLGSVPLIDGVATLPFPLPSRASNLFLVTYAGGGGFAPSTGYLTLSAAGYASSTTLNLPFDESGYDMLTPMGATVQGNGPPPTVPTGVVDFYDDSYGIDLGTTFLNDGAAEYGAYLPLGLNVINAYYFGNAEYDPQPSGVGAILVLDSVDVLNPLAAGALSLSGTSKIAMPGAVIDDSDSPSALAAGNKSSIDAAFIGVVGGVVQSAGASLSPAPATGLPYQPDVVGLPEPSVGSVPVAVALAGNTTRTINPGVYSQITVSGKAHLILNPGVYVVAGGGITVSGSGTVTVSPTGPFDPTTGYGVIIDNSGAQYPQPGGPFGGITISGSAGIDLIPAEFGPYAGIAIFQPYENTQPIVISGGTINLDGGALYAPSAWLLEAGGAQLDQVAVVVDELSLSGSASVIGLNPFVGPGASAVVGVGPSIPGSPATGATARIATGSPIEPSTSPGGLLDPEALEEVAAGLVAMGAGQGGGKPKGSSA